MVRPPYPVAVRLCGIAAEHWGALDAHYYQINLLKLRPHRFANLVWAWFVSRLSAEDYSSAIEALYEPLPWQSADSQYAVELESESFAQWQNG